MATISQNLNDRLLRLFGDASAYEELFGLLTHPVSSSFSVFTGSGNVAMTAGQEAQFVNKTTGGATTVTLPPAPSNGDVAFVKDLKGDAGTNNITVQAAASATIDAGSSHVIKANYGSAIYLFGNGQWSLFSNYAVPIPESQYTTGSLASTTFTAGQLTGAYFTVYTNTASTPGTLTTRTASQMFGDFAGAQIGMTYNLRIANTGSGTLTLAAGSGVTLNGTTTVAGDKFRDYVVTFNSATALTIQGVGTATAP